MLVPSKDVSYLDEILLDEQGRLRPVEAAQLAEVPLLDKQLWGHLNGVYGLPTVELVERIRALIAGRSAIEIGSGNGCLGRALGIPMTDSFMQEEPWCRAIYASMQQPTVRYGADVEKLDAAAALRKYRPEVVVGSWITQLYSPVSGGGNVAGVDELGLREAVKAYVMFGSVHVHNTKVLCSLEHTVYQEPYMHARTHDPALFVWGEHPPI